MRIVLDTNILVSGLISGASPPGQLLLAVRQRKAVLVTSAYQIEELKDVLGRERLRPYIKRDEAEELLYNLGAVAEVVTDLPPVDASPDPKDNPILATAIAGKAELIVSGDKRDMLDLGEIKGIAIVTAREALERLRQRKGS